MSNNRLTFLQCLLIILALLFTMTVRYIEENRSVRTMTGGMSDYGNVTVSEAFSAFLAESR